MQQAGRVHGRDRAAKLHADADDIGRAKDRAALEQLLERGAADEFHPHANPIADLLRAVDGDDVRMPDFGEQPAFLNGFAFGERVRGRLGGQELQRDFACEPRVPGAEHLAERATPDALEQAEVAPTPEIGGLLPCLRRPRQGLQRPVVAEQADDGCHELQVPNERPGGRPRA